MTVTTMSIGEGLFKHLLLKKGDASFVGRSDRSQKLKRKTGNPTK
jgi:hypothetical protein